MRSSIQILGFLSQLCFSIHELRYSNNAMFLLVESPSHLEYMYEIMPSDFIGTPFPKHPHYGIPVVLADPPDACTPLHNIYLEGMAVLAVRGGCTFIEKVINIEQAGGILAMVSDNDSQGVDLVDMVHDDNGERKPQIPAAFIAGASGFRWMDYLKQQSGNKVLITIPLNYSTSTIFNIGVGKPPWELW